MRSVIQQYYRNPPAPFGPDWRQAHIPGWGANPNIVGPRTVGFGEVARMVTPSALRSVKMASVSPGITTTPILSYYQTTGEEGALAGESTFPWIYVFAGAAVLGAGVLFAFKKGRIGR